MQQQQASYDLLAVFPTEATAEAAASKLRKEGYGEDEVFQLTEGTVGSGEFRQHGPNLDRREFFLQTQRSGPNPGLVVALAVVLGLVVGGGTFEAGTLHLAALSLPEPTSAIGGGIVGAILGAVIGLTRRGTVRGAIGQNTKNTTRTTPAPSASGAERKTASKPLTVVALRFPDPENISRKSRARAILINSGGKIDRSVGRAE